MWGGYTIFIPYHGDVHFLFGEQFPFFFVMGAIPAEGPQDLRPDFRGKEFFDFRSFFVLGPISVHFLSWGQFLVFGRPGGHPR